MSKCSDNVVIVMSKFSKKDVDSQYLKPMTVRAVIGDAKAISVGSSDSYW